VRPLAKVTLSQDSSFALFFVDSFVADVVSDPRRASRFCRSSSRSLGVDIPPTLADSGVDVSMLSSDDDNDSLPDGIDIANGDFDADGVAGGVVNDAGRLNLGIAGVGAGADGREGADDDDEDDDEDDEDAAVAASVDRFGTGASSKLADKAIASKAESSSSAAAAAAAAAGA
jgi:hypothetical protein